MRTTINYNGVLYKSGDEVFAMIYGKRLEKARIFINEDKLWLCHNDSSYDGDRSPDRLGFLYSWAFHLNDGILSDNASLLANLNANLKYRKETFMSNELYFFTTAVCPSVSELLYLGYYLPEYSEISLSKNKGMLSFSSVKDGKKRVVEIKIGRYLTQTISKHNEEISKNDNQKAKKIDLNNKDIENIVNKYISLQNKELYFSFLSGDDIYESYNTDYQVANSTLSKSCMNNKRFLSLYTKNTDVVRVLVLRNDDKKIIGRALVWKLSDGTFYMDRVYYAYDYIHTIFIDKAKSEGWKYNGDGVSKDLSVDIKYNRHETYPYVDTFCIMVGNKLYMSPPEGRYTKLRSTSGSKAEY